MVKMINGARILVLAEGYSFRSLDDGFASAEEAREVERQYDDLKKIESEKVPTKVRITRKGASLRHQSKG